LLTDTDLIIDAFDNAASRKIVQDHARSAKVPCLHVGLAADYCETIWDETVSRAARGGGGCLRLSAGENVVMLAVVVASEVIVRFAMTEERSDWMATLGDLAITRRADAPSP
jgi:hypothetical protein